MNSQSFNLKRSALFSLASAFVIAIFMQVSSAAQQDVSKAPAAKPAKRAFDTPDQAAEALVKAAESYDVAALLAILGSDGRDLIVTGEPARDKETATAFAAQARRRRHRSARDEGTSSCPCRRSRGPRRASRPGCREPRSDSGTGEAGR